MLVQHGAFDAAVPASAVIAIDEAAASATAEIRTYPTGHFITSPEAMNDRAQFLIAK